jgi:hypothetical protein
MRSMRALRVRSIPAFKKLSRGSPALQQREDEIAARACTRACTFPL